MKNNKKIDDKTVKEIDSFIKEEIWASRIWVFSGIVISILLCMMLKNYMIFELDNIIQPLRKLKLPDIKGIFLTILFILEVLLLFTLPKILINRQKKNMKSGLILISLMTGLILSIFFGKFLFFITQKTVIAGIMLILALILIILIIKKDVKNIQIKILKKLETNGTEILEKTRFFSAIILYSDIVKIVVLYLLLALVISIVF